jgi:hypothetical protein
VVAVSLKKAARANPLTAFLARRVVRLPSFAMPNLIVGAPVVPEFLQEKARPERIGLALAELIEGPAREVQLAHLRRVRQRLGSGGAAERAAAIAERAFPWASPGSPCDPHGGWVSPSGVGGVPGIRRVRSGCTGPVSERSERPPH